MQDLQCGGFQGLCKSAPKSFVMPHPGSQPVSWDTPMHGQVSPELLATNKRQGVNIYKLTALLKNM